MRMDYMIGGVLTFLLALSFLGLLYGIVAAPVLASAEARCLSQGYPRAQVTWDFKHYCTTLDGAVTVRVEPQ